MSTKEWITRSNSGYLAKRQVVPVRPGERMVAWLERQHTVKPHPRRAAPHEHIAVFQQQALCLVRALQPAQQKYTLQAKRDGDDRLAQVEFMPILMQTEFRARLVPVDVA